ncbi:alpha/beta hydrolase [Aestuariibaculum lutulentum]|uniref:Alpha/beta hydrolase n=1 Tax=Aestuariibaculum lutulentum TaxID=2920935 RepID=A0ABS9RKG0_9FLAO|nr:alpha/beta hydrolase [Aestuariibaculum lutulentum]MCH4553445.1 alpha/beta hydrolase [Aestuariibaculum lutulentum]
MKYFLLVAMLVSVTLGNSQEIIRLYEGKAPGSENWNYQEIEFYNSGTNTRMLRNVVDPTLEVYVPEESIANGTAVIICPGGGNVWLSYESEGTAVAEWLVKKGITAFVLKYRLNKTPIDKSEFKEFWNNFGKSLKKEKGKREVPEKPVFYGGDDGIKAVQYVRENSKSFGVDPNKIGMIGFSAGAGVTMHTILNVSPEDQLNFAGLIYGGWLNDAEVPASVPPVFILCAADDFIAANSPEVFKAWRDAGKSAELHVYSKGGHGFGMDKKNLPVDSWIDRFHEWLSLTVLKGE